MSVFVNRNACMLINGGHGVLSGDRVFKDDSVHPVQPANYPLGRAIVPHHFLTKLPVVDARFVALHAHTSTTAPITVSISCSVNVGNIGMDSVCSLCHTALGQRSAAISFVYPNR